MAKAAYIAYIATVRTQSLVRSDSTGRTRPRSHVVQTFLSFSRCTNDACKLEPFQDWATHADVVPSCPLCGGALRPHVVLFGEAIPPFAAWQVKRALRDCDLFLAIGTSGLVSPAADYARSAEYAGARTVLVNLEPMQIPNPAFKEVYLGKAEDILPGLLGAAT